MLHNVSVSTLREVKAVEDSLWKRAAMDLAKNAPFYTGDFYRLLVSRGLYNGEKGEKRFFFGQANRVLRELVDAGELSFILAPAPRAGIRRKYYHRPGRPAEIP